MRKLYLLLLLCTITVLANAQLVNLYSFSQNNGTYTGITGGNVLGSNTSDDEVFNNNTAGAFGPVTDIGFPIGFNFSYNGQTFDRFAVCYNGFIVLGTGSFPIGGTTTGVISSTSAGLVSNVISAMNVDIDATDSAELSYSTIGTAPNRTLVVQWKNVMRYGQTGSVINMQIRLNENGNTVQFVYGNVVGPASTSTPQVGIKGLNNTDFHVRTSTTSWAATTNAATNAETIAFSTTIFPASGLAFTFTPPSGCTSAPPAGTVVGNNTVCAGVPFSLTVNGVTPTSGYAYQWQSSANGTDWTDINGQIGVALNTTTTGVTYYRRITTCTNTSQSTASSSFMVTANAPTFATLPYNESFENTWQALCGDSSRATPNNSWRGVPTSGNTSWRRHDDGPNALWSSTSGLYSPVSSDGNYSARFHTYDASSGTFGNLDLYINGATASATKRITYDMINTSGTDTLFVQLSTDNGATFIGIDTVTSLAGAWRSRSRIFTTTSAQTIIRFRARSDYGVTDIGLDNISVVDFPSCNGAPVTPVIAAAATTLCDAGTRTFTITAGNNENGVAFQWQISPDSTLWIPVAGQTGTSYAYVAPNSFTGVFVRLISRCIATGDSSISNAIRISPASSAVYATLPVAENFDNVWASVCDTRDVPNSSWRNAPVSGSRSWRRYDDAAGGNWTSPTSGTYTPNGSNGTPFSARFHSFGTTTGQTGTLDIYFNGAGAVATKRLTYDVYNSAGNDSLVVLLSTDGGQTFARLDSARSGTTAWRSKLVQFNTTSATSVIRFMGYGVASSGDIGLDNIRINELPPCSGTPTGGTITRTNGADTVACSGVTLVFNATGQSSTDNQGISYQWEFSTDSISWSPIAGAVTVPVTIVTPSGFNGGFYRLAVTCSNSSSVAYSNSLRFGAPPVTYATLPVVERFESAWVNVCGTRDVPNNSWRNRFPATDSSWRRNDDGAAANWGSVGSYAYTPSGSNGSSFSARFHSGNISSGRRGALSLFFNGNTVGNLKRLSYDVINTSGTDSLIVELSTDGGNTFSVIDTAASTAGGWRNKVVFFSTTSANSVLRFTGRADFGVTDIGLDSVRVEELPPCTGSPNAGTITVNNSSVCTGSVVNFTVSGHTTLQSGLIYKWQESDNNSLWNDIAGTQSATTANYTFTVPTNYTPKYYRLAVSCNNGSFVFSNSIQLTVPAISYAALPYTQSFENTWSNSCSTRDVPEAGFWRNTPFTGNTSWRRDNDTTGAGWTNMNNPAAPTGANTTSRYARFHSSILTTGTGTFDLFLNCTTGNPTKEVKFFYANTNGTDSLRVFVSTDGGNSFTRIGSVLTTSNPTNFWDEVSIPFTSTSATTVVRFVAYATGTNASDIGIDEVSVSTVACAQPQNVQVTAITPAGAGATRATVTWNNVAGNLGYEIAFAATNTPPPFGDVVLPNVVTYLDTTSVPANSNAFAFVRTFCAGGATSSWAVVPFFAPCAVGTLPYNEGFESITTANTLPECMSATELGTLTQTYLSRQTTYFRKPRTGSKFASFRYSTTNRHLFSRPLLLQAGVQYGAEVWYVSDGTNIAGWDSLKLQIATSQSQAGIIQSLARVAPVPNSNIDTNYVRVAGNFTPATTGIYYLTVSAYGTSAPWYLSFDDLQLAPGNALPVTISSFTAERKGSTNLLQWITSTEANNLGFEIERSADGRNFTKVGYVASSATNGNSTQPISYNFTDALPLTGNNYYRLKQVDKDGKTSFSNIALVKGNFGKELTLTAVYPNPATTTLNVLMNAPAFSKTQIVVTDLAGKVLNTYNYQLNAGDNTLSVNVAALPSGTYLIKAICDNGCESAVKKFFKQ
ncbi:MAG: T9SS type A sorting domain-containing protein [Chitinophagaceae bacterium]